MPDEIANPLAEAPPTFEPPSGNHTFSQEVRDFANAPVAAIINGAPGSRPPSNAEIVARLAQARDLIPPERYWQERGPPPLSAEQKAEAERLRAIGVNPAASAADYTVALPPGVPADTGDRIKGFLASLQFSGSVGNHIAQRISHNLEHYGKLSEADRATWQAQQQNMITQWAINHGWDDLPAKQEAVRKLLAKSDQSVAAFAVNDFDVFVRLVNLAEDLKR